MIRISAEKLHAEEEPARSCNSCGKLRLLSDFYKSKLGRYGRRSKCKECMREEGAEFRDKYKSDGWKVYYLPEEHYVGMASDLKRRLNTHRRGGRIIENYEIIAKFERAVDAHFFETHLHIRGYYGFNY